MTLGILLPTRGRPDNLARFIEGRPITDIERAWDQMYFSTQYYGRRGIVVNAISAVDLALWDLLAKWRKEPAPTATTSAARGTTVRSTRSS